MMSLPQCLQRSSWWSWFFLSTGCRRRQADDSRSAGQSCVTPLHYAAKKGHVEPMCLLLEAGAEIDAPSRTLARAPLHMAAECGHLDGWEPTTMSSPHRGPGFDSYQRKMWLSGHGPLPSFLLGCDKEMTNQFGATPLIAAAKNVAGGTPNHPSHWTILVLKAIESHGDLGISH